MAGLLSVAVVSTAGPAPAGAVPVPIQTAREVRTTWTNEFGIARPTSVAYVPRAGELLVGGPTPSATTVARVDFDEQSKGSMELPALSNPSTLAYDARRNELTGIDDSELVVAPGTEVNAARPRVRRDSTARLGVRDAQGSTFDPATGTWYVLDARNRDIVRVANRSNLSASRIPLSDVAGTKLRGLAFNPNDGLLYVGSPNERRVYSVNTAGRVQKAYDLTSIGLRNPTEMTFAPSADTTDPVDQQSLYIAQAGDASMLGGVTEVTLLAAPAATVATTTATLVQTIATSTFNPPSPDTSGIAYLGPIDRMHIVDSEVDETTGAGYHGANMWQFTRTGTMTATGTTFPRYSKEPTGVAYDPVSNTMFISDDSARRVHVVKPGPNGKFGDADDVVSFIDAKAVGSTDTEDPAFDPVSRNLFFSDAVSTEVYRVNPVNGVFGDGNDVITHFDVGALGPTDSEGLAYYAPDDALLVGDRTTRKIYEITKTGTLLHIYNAKVGNYSVLSGLTVGPASDNSGRQDIWIASRGVDNGAQPTENDGKVVEISVGGVVDPPPSVSITSPADGATVSGTAVSIQASASDNVGVTSVQFFDGATALGTDTNGGDGWSLTWNTTTTANGAHTIRATATDTAGQTATDTNNVTVSNTSDPPPSVSITSPANGATVSGTAVSIQASASDNVGVTSVQFFDGATALGTDTNGGDGWSVTWPTTSTANGAHTIRATATDTAGQTATDTNNVTVNNGGSVQVLDVPIVAGGDDIEERTSDGRIDAASTDLDMLLDNTVPQTAVGMRFTQVSVPHGAAITNAYVQFKADENSSEATSLTINGIAQDNANPFPTAVFSLSRAARTAAAVGWNPVAWVERQAGLDQRTPNLAAVVQQIVDRPGWASGNALALVITGSGRRVAKSFEAAAPPVLHIEYTLG